MSDYIQIRLSDANAMLDSIRASYNNGYLRFYNGTKPATCATALSGNTLGSEHRFASVAFPSSASGGTIVAASISTDPSADAGLTPIFWRAFASDGTTVLSQGDAGVTGSGAAAQFTVVPTVTGQVIFVTSFSITIPT